VFLIAKQAGAIHFQISSLTVDGDIFCTTIQNIHIYHRPISSNMLQKHTFQIIIISRIVLRLQKA
jgi:hypothetical protein